MPTYTVESPTGQRIKFDWTDVNPPTDVDMEEIFAQAGGGQEQPLLEGQEARRAALPEAPLTAGEVAGGAVESFVPSGIEAAQAIGEAVLHPVETVKGITQVIRGAGGKASEAFLGALGVQAPDIESATPEVRQALEQSEEEKASFSAVADFFKQRYGGIEEAKRTIATDPVGFMADLSLLLRGGGGIAGKIPKAGKVAETLRQVGRAVEPVRAVAETIKLPLKGAGVVAETVAKVPFKGAIPKVVGGLSPERLAETLFQSAFKMSKKLSPSERATLTKIGIRDKIFPTQHALDVVDRKISILDKKVSRAISRSSRKFDDVSANEVIKSLDELETFYKNQAVGGPKALETIREIKETFVKERGQRIPIAKAQKIKQATQQRLRKDFGEMKTLQKEAQKGLSHGLREEIAKIVPEAATLNKELASYIRFQEALESAVASMQNKDILSLGQKVVISGAGQGPLFKITAGLLDVPKVKIALAVALSESTKISKVEWVKRLGALKEPAFQAGRIQQQTGER
jgi:hypothetical protein